MGLTLHMEHHVYDKPDIEHLEEIHLRRLTVDEALFRLERFLNDAFLAGVPTVRVIHGKGTGTLRQAVQETLRTHPLVKSFRRASLEEGGAGATVAEMADY